MFGSCFGFADFSAFAEIDEIKKKNAKTAKAAREDIVKIVYFLVNYLFLE